MLDNKIKTIGIIANCAKPRAEDVLTRIVRKAEELGINLVTCGETCAFLPGATQVEPKNMTAGIDVLMALGGDGTMLRAVRTLTEVDVPVIGVNLGSLGFMTSITEEYLEEALEVLAKGAFETSVRTLLECELIRDGQSIFSCRALNDIVIGWGASSRVITLELVINDEQVTSYVCDGMIISTPTGSTGHSLSAMGPILHPETKAFLVNVICPHTLSERTLVIPDDRVIKIQASHMPQQKNLILSVDGQTEDFFRLGDQMVIRKHPLSVRFIHLADYSYFNLLRQKLHWRGSNV